MLFFSTSLDDTYYSTYVDYVDTLIVSSFPHIVYRRVYTRTLSRLTVVSRAAKQSRTRDTTVCYYTWTINSNRTLTWSVLLKITLWKSNARYWNRLQSLVI